MIYCLDSIDKINYDICPVNENLIEALYLKFLPNNSVVIFNSTPPVNFVDWWNNVALPIIAKSNISYIIWDLASNPISADHCATIANLDHPIPYYCCVGNFDLYKQQLPSKALFFPYWAIWSSFQPLEKFKLHRTYKLSSLNGNDWSHRKYAYLQLAKRSYFNQMVFTFGIRKTQFDSVLDSIALTEEDLAEFDRLPPLVTFNETDHADNLDIHTSHPAFQDTYINLVNETSVSIGLAIASEKTFKPIRAHQLFVNIAAAGVIKFLREIGFDVFDDIIDHSYDLVADKKLRVRMAVEQLDRLEQMDLPTLFAQIQPRLEKNARWLVSQEFRDQFKLDFG